MTNEPTDISGYLDSLDREGEQDVLVNEHRESFFEGAPPAETIVRRAREFDDIEKHLVRREHWLKIAKHLRAVKGSGLRLLTLPGKYRLEVELYVNEKLLAESGTESLAQVDVVGFETDPTNYGLLEVDKPAFAALYNRDLARSLTEPTSQEYKELAKLFPFDIVNLDFTVPLATASDGPYSRQLKSIKSCLRLQGSQPSEWALFVTFRSDVGATSQDVLEQWISAVDQNIADHPQVRDAFYEKFGVLSAKDLIDKLGDAGLGELAMKWIIDQAHVDGWKVEEVRHLTYSRAGPPAYLITKLTFRFRRQDEPRHALPGKKLATLGWHVEDLVRSVKSASRVDITSRLETARAKESQYVQSLEKELAELKRRPDFDTPEPEASSGTSGG